MTLEQQNTALKVELKRVLECGFRLKEMRAGWRFSFRVSNQTYDHWQQLIGGPINDSDLR